jgi:hypothetical protein
MDVERGTEDGVGPNGIDVRIYKDGERDYPSVTSILKTRDSDDDGLHSWQDENDGVGDNADHSHLFWYSRQIGTLSHWHALSYLDPQLTWTNDEATSLYKLNNVDELNDPDEHEDVYDATPKEVLYSVLKNYGSVSSWGDFYDVHDPYETHDYYSEHLVKRATKDVQYFTSTQKQLWAGVGLTPMDVIAVEQYLMCDEYEYAGQVDLVYEDQYGNNVVADLKSSSGCYPKHQLQGAAYGRAIELSEHVPVDTVDRLEVHRTNPRRGEAAIHTHDDAPDQLPIHTTKYWEDSFDNLFTQFADLTADFEYDND